ncbi:tetratricopeptide repeat protein [Tsukamurella sp. 8F]|uniref:serine/threonine-protein kinase n=1 Tax=unclassified Tsukamurella TaxID=2633480 RepID=UPI0023B8A4BD|nr:MULTISPECIES: serine/threonine-protein kinase [unclassified Tsukamurella]MDF0529805.1 tetratricopeptide repeat protein [Tsukamurella sp. 8J]MDF0586997.1 tetratricopeptide repeat protein [Tsukamurella sp. 8F]
MTTTGACARPGCNGSIDADGFCDSCGMEATPPSPAPDPGVTASRAGDLGGPGTAAAEPGTAATPYDPFTSATGAATGSATGRGAGGFTGSARSRRGSSRSSGRSGRSGRRGLLGAGLVEVPRVPYRDPQSAVLADPKVPESRRFCSKCGAEVGRARDGSPGRTEGFCPACRNPFSFSPKLAPGEVVHGQYEVLGCLAHGGLGWIYLAADRAVADRWVVLKGLLDSGDADAMAAAVAERRFLAEVEHPNIVKIYNFVEHPDSNTGAPVGYIVMEYVGGESIKGILQKIRATEGHKACLPLPQAIAYALEVLPALGYLHSKDLLFCDFKPDNVIQTEEQLKLIDLGAVRAIEDEDSPIYGTIGYQAPEIGTEGPSVQSDLYTIGRALAVLTFPFDYLRAHKETLPDATEEPLLAQQESYHRFLLRATSTHSASRFASADEMRDQLTGVLREVLAEQDGKPRPGTSTEFTPERASFGITAALAPPSPAVVAAALPVPKADSDDPSAAFLATVTAIAPERVADELGHAPKNSPEVRLRLARAHLDAGDTAAARRLIDGVAALTADSERTWPIAWYRGIAALTDGDVSEAVAQFDLVYSAVPGEQAPKLALAACAEQAGDHRRAAQLFRAVWRTDAAYVSAAFGLARALAADGDRRSAYEVLCTVPDTSSHRITARLAAAAARVEAVRPERLAADDLLAAGTQIEGIDDELDARRRALASERVLGKALEWVHVGGSPPPDDATPLLGARLAEPDLRAALEGCYRTLARHASSPKERIALVDKANRIRPKSWM